MSKFRNFKLKDGKVSIKDFTKDKADLFEQYCYEFGQEQDAPKPNEALSGQLTEKALGLRENAVTKEWEIVVVAYNPVTKEAKVEQVKGAGNFRQLALNSFKQELLNQKLL